MRIYLDICCFKRPHDGQSQARIYLETEAKLILQQKILTAKYTLMMLLGEAIAFLENWYEN